MSPARRLVPTTLVVGVALAVVGPACNALTGASDLEVTPCESCGASGGPGTSDAEAPLPGPRPIAEDGGFVPPDAAPLPDVAGGFLDTTFGAGGVVITNLASDGLAVAPRADGRVYVAGVLNGDTVVLRFLPTGAPDTAFGGNSRVGTGNGVRLAALLLSGAERPTVAGAFDVTDGDGNTSTFLALYRWDDAGKADGSFGNGFAGAGTAPGPSTDSMTSGAAVGGGAFVVVGSDASQGLPRRTTFWRFTATGAADATFGATGRQAVRVASGSADDAPFAVAAGAGAIAAAGQIGNAVDMGVARVSANGAVDAPFGGGKATVSIGTTTGPERATAVAIAGTGETVVGGEAPVGASPTRSPLFGVARFSTTGQLDTTFGGTGKQTISFAAPGITYAAQADYLRAVSVDARGRVLAVGFANERVQGTPNTISRVVMTRLTRTGAPDPLFGQDGKLTFRFDVGQAESVVSSAAVDAAGKYLYVVGRAGNKLALARIVL